ncbi:MAG TPA: hypothetical protein PLI95_23300, partial [Polyangiaceae bacterium]|nr:hypothetical protein [Polyangiaceae bacterium]
ASRIPRGDTLSSWTLVSCTQGHAIPASVVDHVRLADGSSVLIERMSTPNVVVITNAFVEGRHVVFQFVQQTVRPQVLWEYRIPLDTGDQGGFRVSNAFTLEALPGGAFRGVPGEAKASCTLQRVLPPGAAQTASSSARSGAGAQPASEAPRGWGYDGKSFVAGDRVLVDVEGRSVPAKVVQATGEMYYVQVEGLPGAGGQWVAPGRITGRFR